MGHQTGAQGAAVAAGAATSLQTGTGVLPAAVRRGSPHWVDRIEKVGRGVLWLAMASACILAPVEYVRLHTAEAEAKEAARKAEAQAKADAEKAEKEEKAAHEPHRLSLASMGSVIRGLALTAAGEQGSVWVTNVSPRHGFLCVVETVTNRATKKTTSSIPSCTSIAAYSTVHVSLMFASTEFADVCPKLADCDVSVDDAPEGKDVPLASQ
jgi:hypothetical protein